MNTDELKQIALAAAKNIKNSAGLKRVSTHADQSNR